MVKASRCTACPAMRQNTVCQTRSLQTGEMHIICHVVHLKGQGGVPQDLTVCPYPYL
jgi:hypothetical protein